MRAGERIAAEADEDGDRLIAGEMLRELGLMHVVCYVTNRFWSNYEYDLAVWRESLHDMLGADASVLEPEQWRMPE